MAVWGTSEPQKPRAPETSSSRQGFLASTPLLRSLWDAPAVQPYLELQLGSQEVALGWWLVPGSAGLWGAEEGETHGGCKIGEVPLLQHPSAGRGGEMNLPALPARALPSPHLRRWLLEGWRLHDFGRPVAVVPLLLLGQLLLHQVNVTAGGDGG